MRALIYGMLASLSVAVVPALAGEVRQFEIQNLRLGMTVAEIKEAGKKAGVGEFRELRSPSFEQSVALAQRRNVSPSAFAGIQELRAKLPKASVQISLVPTPAGPKAWRIVYSWLDTSLNRDTLRQEIFRQYGQPERQIDREWLWGDTSTFFDARTKPYLEFRLDPASAGVEKPLASLTLADQSLQRTSKESIDSEARK